MHNCMYILLAMLLGTALEFGTLFSVPYIPKYDTHTCQSTLRAPITHIYTTHELGCVLMIMKLYMCNTSLP